MRARRLRSDLESGLGQASVEFVAIVPAVIIAALLLFQLLAVGYTVTILDGAAASGAMAVADGRSADAAAKRSLPGWAADRAAVEAHGGRVEVRVRAPSVVPGIGDRFELSSTAAVAEG